MDTRKGTLFVMMAAILYSIGGLCIKFIPWGGIAINGTRSAVALVVVAVYLKATHHALKWNRWICIGAWCIALTTTLFSVANKMTTAANAIVLEFTAPAFVIVFSAVLLRKRPARLDLIACALVFGGIVFFFVDSLEMGGGLGNMVALCSGITYSGVFLMSDMPGDDPLSSLFWGEVFSTVLGLPFLFRETEFPPSAIVSLLILGVFQVAVAYICLCTGLKTTPPVTASLVAGIEPILNPIWVAVFYGETIGSFALVGAAIVIFSVVGYNVLNVKEGSCASEAISSKEK